jgi:hypothetical protein
MPFWFWNDDLNVDEITRQMEDFQQHGVEGFVIHPRVGLPRHLGWMSERLLEFYRAAIVEARRRGMVVVLYDEGMYPSGSSSGQVVAKNPVFACRCLAKVDLARGQEPELKPGETLVAIARRGDGSRLAVIDRPARSVIRGLHYLGEGPAENEPPAADILNPQAVATFLHLVYDQFAANFEPYFGNTILAIFTDEPGLLGRSRERGIVPGTTGILAHINRILGYDFTPHLPALWYEDEPKSAHFRQEYLYALSLRLEETYYQPLQTWCEAHGLALTGHPAKGDDIGPLRYFHIPGQDLVWRWVLPDQPSALEGAESTQAKCAASAMLHAGRRRNANECCGAYGHELTWDEMNWLARWVFVRGANLLFPHAFYYSVRGVRVDERPPDVGPHSPWWGRYREYAQESRRLSWINTDARHLCHLAILGRADHLPWRAAKTCFCNQYDFNYIEERDILEKASIDTEGLHLAGMTYTALILEHDPRPEVMAALEPLALAGGVIRYQEEAPPEDLLKWLGEKAEKTLLVTPESPALRVRHLEKGGLDYFLLFNEEHKTLELTPGLSRQLQWFIYDAVHDRAAPLDIAASLVFERYELKILIGVRDPAAEGKPQSW